MKRYQIQFELGSGAMAKVYAAHDVDMDREVALKILHDSAAANSNVRQRFLREARISASLSHPNLVTVHDAGEEEGKLYLVMELVEGDSLSHVLERKDYQLKDVVGVIEAAARGVHHAHQKGAVHRDLKPANILIPKKGVPKVADFGLAHLMYAEGDSLLTRSGTALGTPVYMAPEQARGANTEISARTDVYALGAILYEACTGRPPFDGKSVVEIYRKITGSPVLPPRRLKPGLPEALDRICLKALEKDPALRFASAEEFADDLKSWLSGKEVRARRAGFGARVGSSLRRNTGSWILSMLFAAVLVVAGSVALVVATRPKPGGPTPTGGSAATPSPTPRPGPAFAKVRDATLSAFRDLEAGFLGDPARRGLEARVAEIEKAAGPDPAGRAWAALAAHLAGKADGRARIEAAAKDSGDDPWPWLLLALASFEDWAKEADISLNFGANGVTVTGVQVEPGMVKSLEAALVALDRATSRAAGESSARTFRKLAEALAMAGRKEWTEAAARAAEAGTDPLLSAVTAYLRGYFLAWDRRFDEVEKAVDPLAARTWPRAHHLAGVARMAQGVLAQVAGQDGSLHLKPAIERLQKSSDLAPDYLGSYQYRAVARLWLGSIEGSQGKEPFATWDAGIRDLDALLAKSPGAMGSWNSRGNLHRYKADALLNRRQDPVACFDRAIEDYTKAIDLGYRDGGPFQSRGYCHQQKGNVQFQNRQDPVPTYIQAIRDLDEAAKRMPQAVDIHFQKGRLRVTVTKLYGQRTDRDKAIPMLMNEAIQDFTKVLQLQPDHAEALQGRGETYQEGGDLMGASPEAGKVYELSIQDFTALIALKPAYAKAHADRANCWLRLANRDPQGAEYGARLQKAWEGYDEALKHDPAYWNAMTGKGTILEGAGKFAEAVQWFEKAMAAGKDNAHCQQWCAARIQALKAKLSQ